MSDLVLPSTGLAGGSAQRLTRRASKLLSGLARQMAARRTIAELSALDDRTLRDIGLHRSQICAAAYGGLWPPWRHGEP